MAEYPRPVSADGEVEIAVEVAGICGSDVSGFLGHSARRKPPLVLGHELVGRTAEGQRVVVNPLISCAHCPACLSGRQNLCSTWRLLGMDQTSGTFAEFVSLPSAQVYSIPASMSTPRAILTEPLANVVHLFRLLSPAPFFRVAIVGAGTMGTLALLTARQIGAAEIVVTDVNDERLQGAAQMGAHHAINTGSAEGLAEAKQIVGYGFDIVIDASGSRVTRQMALDLCRPGGQVLLLGMAEQRSEVDFVTSIRREHRILTSFAYTPVDFERALQLLVSGSIDLDRYTVQTELESGQQAFETMTQRPGATLKVMLKV